jgi:Sec-independent protein secretion pathway component TatC
MAGGDISNTSLKTIFIDVDQRILDYSLYTYGYHFGDTFQHIFIDEHMNDFEEMLLHHIAAVCLYFSYIFGNMLYIGSVIAYLHDLADIFGKICKGLNATIYQDSSAVFFVCCMITWFATRIYTLPQMIYFIYTKCIYPTELERFQPYITFSAIFLSTMCALHFYWFAMFIKIL